MPAEHKPIIETLDNWLIYTVRQKEILRSTCILISNSYLGLIAVDSSVGGVFIVESF